MSLIESSCSADLALRTSIEREAHELELRLMVILEGNGLPLAARRIAAELSQIRQAKQGAGGIGARAR